MGTLGGNTVYHMGTLSRASKNRDMARESEKQQQVKKKNSVKMIICLKKKSSFGPNIYFILFQVVDSAYGTTRSVKKVYL